MILPIVAFGDNVLREEAQEIEQDYPQLKELISNMFETMESARGVGLAAPQIGKAIRLFVIDASPFAEDDQYKDQVDVLKSFRKVFINPEIINEEGKKWAFEEGCLSIPGIREDVWREPNIHIEYYDENFVFHSDKFNGLPARVIQHEYDHIEGVLFTDHLNPLKKRLLKRKLNEISKGIVDINYKMRFPIKIR